MKCHLEELVLAGALFHGILHQKAERKVILFPVALYHSTSTLFHVPPEGMHRRFCFSRIPHVTSCFTWNDFLKRKSRVGAKEIFLQRNIFLILFLSSCCISGLASCYGFGVVSPAVCVCVCVYWSVLVTHVIEWVVSLAN